MKSFVITKIGKCFEIASDDLKIDAIDNLFAVVDINYVYENIHSGKDGTITLIFNENSPTYDFKTDIFIFSKEITGRFFEEGYYGRAFEAGCMITDVNSKISHMCYFGGKFTRDSTDYWVESSIVRAFVNFLNILVQFESLNDYIIYKENHTWKNKDLSDKILQLAKVIELYKKYYEINRALSITHKMEKLIDYRLEILLKENYKPETES